MNKELKKRKNMVIILLVLFIVGIVSFSIVFSDYANNVFSIGGIINEQTSLKTVDQAIDYCESKLVEVKLLGKDCGDCLLHCPGDGKTVKQSNGKYTVEYTNSNLYTGKFTDVECDFIQNVYVGSGATPLHAHTYGSLFEVQAQCEDTIRVCREQVGNSETVDRISTTNGEIRKIKYSYQNVNCDTKKVISGAVRENEYQYKLYCDTGYTVNGKRYSSSKSSLGDCVSATSESGYTGDAELSGKFVSVTVKDVVTSNKELNIAGSFKAEETGRYYIYGTFEEATNPLLSLVSGSGINDLCGSDEQTSGVFFDLNKGDTALFTLSIRSPSETNTYNVKIGVKDGCIKPDIDSVTKEVRVLGTEEHEEEVIVGVITEDPTLLNELEDGMAERIAEILDIEICVEDNLVFDGCVFGECDGTETVLYDIAVCNGNETVNIVDIVEEQETIYENKGNVVGNILIGVTILFVIMIVVFLFKSKEKAN